MKRVTDMDQSELMAEVERLRGDEKDSFERGYLIAVSNLISHIGTGTEVEELMSAARIARNRSAELGLCEWDQGNLAQYFDAEDARASLSHAEEGGR